MRISTAISTALFLLPALSGVSAQGNQRKGGKGNNNNNNNNNNNAGNNDPQKSLTLDPKVIASGFANDGQDVPVAGQVASLTSSNNFINFCLTVPNLPITNGKQITTGSCNPSPIGVIPSVDKMPSSKFTNPKNGDTIAANQAFTISMAISNLEAGNFVNAQSNYFASPQHLNGNGLIIGHTHVVVESLQSLSQTTPTNPKQFAFFKGVNGAAKGGIVTADVTAGLPAGVYRLCSMNAAANHQPVIVSVAQHGALDDCVYFTAGGAGGGKGAGAGAGATTATATAAGSGAAQTGAAGNGGKGGKGSGGRGGRAGPRRATF